MRILVTGGSGQVGGALAPRLAGRGIVLTPNRSELDLTRPTAIADLLDRIAPDLIVNTAAYTNVDRAEDERELAFAVNAESPAAIARWAAELRVPLLHLSTDYVFDGSGDLPWREDDPTGPLSIYGASKLAGEISIRAAAGPHLIVRTSWIYAAQGRNFLRAIAALAAERAELRVVADQIGAPTSAAVVADGLVRICSTSIDELPKRFAAARGLVHLAAAGVTSWHGFATAIVAGLKARGMPVKADRVVPIASNEYPAKAVRPHNSRLNLSRLAHVLEIQPPHWNVALEVELDRIGKTRSKP